MKSIKSFIYIGLIIFLILFSCGCGNDEPVQVNLSVCETEWSEFGSSTADPIIYTQLKRGDVVYDSNETKITVKSVTENRLVLEIDGFQPVIEQTLSGLEPDCHIAVIVKLRIHLEEGLAVSFEFISHVLCHPAVLGVGSQANGSVVSHDSIDLTIHLHILQLIVAFLHQALEDDAHLELIVEVSIRGIERAIDRLKAHHVGV